jgi:Ca2+-transporting ATPase
MEPSRVISLEAHRAAREPRAQPVPNPVVGLPVLSLLPGRVRFRIAALHRVPSLKSEIEGRLLETASIVSVFANDLTGSVLVLFEPGTDVASLAEKLASIVGAVGAEPQAPATHPSRTARTGAIVHTLRSLVRKPPAAPTLVWHRMTAEAVLAETGGSRAGLTTEITNARLAQYGPNLLPEATPRSPFSIFVGQFKSWPVALLGASALVSAATGGLADAIIIVGVVAINAVIGFVTETQAEQTIRSLTGPMHPLVNVVRDGTLQLIPVEQVTVGDLLAFAPGSYVGADARLIEARRLSVDESSLTGESLPVAKNIAAIVDADVPLADRTNMVFMGTQVTGGQGLAVVIATGTATEIGRIQHLIGEATTPETPMERQLRHLGNQMVWIAGGVCVGVFAVGLLRGYGALQMLKTAISLAVAAVPEGLPTVATTTLALGLREMRRRKVLIRHLEAVETLGAVQVICLDKTGTLTLNRMTVIAAHAGTRRYVVGNGRFITPDGRDTNPFEADELLRLLHVAVLCNETEINGAAGSITLHGSATENALVQLALDAGVDVQAVRARYPRRAIHYRSENRLYMSSQHDDGALTLVALKGSPAEVLGQCTHYVDGGQRWLLDDEWRQRILDENAHLAGDALRVLAFACACPAPGTEPRYDFLGLLGMMDPVRDGAPALIGDLHRAGIETVMITGDQSPTAYSIGRALRLSGNDHLDVLDSTHLEQLEPAMLQALAGRVHVFARVSPSHKLAIVQALQRAGKVVAMTGDGINDGPALKVADIGIAMGNTGTDVARTVADVVLEEDNLETLVIAVSQGRTIYNNIRKSVHFLMATNLSEITVMSGAIALGLGQPLNPMQLLWINLVTDIFPALGLALEPPEPDVLRQPPRDPHEPIVRRGDFRRIALESAVISAGTLGAYGYGIARYGIGPQASAIAFMSLTTAQLLHAISTRSDHLSVFSKERLPPNRFLAGAIGGSLALQGATLLPGLRSLLGLGPLGAADAAVIAAGAALPFVINEATKSGAPPARRTVASKESPA